MKLVRYGNPGKERPGLIDDQGQLRDLSTVVGDIGPAQLADAALGKLRRLKADKLPLVRGKPRFGCPVADVGKFIAIGLNYADHAAESGAPIPKEPIVFMKATSCIQGAERPGDAAARARSRPTGRSSSASSSARARRYVAQKRRARLCRRLLRRSTTSREREFQLERGGTVGQGQGLRHLRPDRPVAGDARRGRRPAAARHVARRQRQAHADRQHPDDDLRRRQARQLPEPVHDPAARRHHHHRHAARRRPRHEAAAVPEAGRRDDASASKASASSARKWSASGSEIGARLPRAGRIAAIPASGLRAFSPMCQVSRHERGNVFRAPAGPYWS